MSQTARSSSFKDSALLGRAVWDSVLKLDPRKMWRNPVMFVVEVGAVAASIDLIDGVMHHAAGFAFSLQITIWLWFTLLFANFAEAMAEGRGKAQADTLRKARSETVANRLLTSGTLEQVASSSLRANDVVVVVAGEFIPGDGEIIDGIVEGRKGAQALQVRLLEALPTVTAAAAKHARKKPDEMIPIIEDLMKLLDGISDAYRRGKHPDPKEARQISSLLTAVAKDLEP